MTEPQHVKNQPPVESEETPRGQKFFDNIFLLLILSFLITALLYNVWGLVEIFTLPHLP